MTLSGRLRMEILARDNFACVYCGNQATVDAALHVDHVIPRNEGGTDDPSNLITACRPCNLGKGKRSLWTAGLDSHALISACRPETLCAFGPSDFIRRPWLRTVIILAYGMMTKWEPHKDGWLSDADMLAYEQIVRAIVESTVALCDVAQGDGWLIDTFLVDFAQAIGWSASLVELAANCQRRLEHWRSV